MTGDAASCAALAADLRSGSRRLRAADGADRADVTALADDLDRLADALSRFAEGLRDPLPLRRGRPFPRTVLRNDLAAWLDADPALER